MKVNLNQKACIIIDYTKQNVYLNERPEWDLSLKKVQSLRPNLEKLVQRCELLNIPVIFIGTVEWSEKNLPENINQLYKSNPEAAFYSSGEDEQVLKSKGKVILKNSYSAFSGSQGKLERLLKRQGINNLIIAGIYSTGCVNATIVEAFAKGYHLTILKDCIATFDRKDKQQYHKILLQDWSRMYGNVVKLADL